MHVREGLLQKGTIKLLYNVNIENMVLKVVVYEKRAMLHRTWTVILLEIKISFGSG